MITLDVKQGSPEWFEARCGIPTASCFDKILTTTGKKSTQSKTYLNKLIAEHFLREKTQTEQNEWMTRGIELESEARDYYQIITDSNVDEVGLIYKDESKMVSCSPDGMLNDRGLEIKCPAPHTHVEYLLGNKLPTKYVLQVHGSMWVTGLDKWDFLSYHPDLPHLLITVERDDDLIGAINEHVNNFLSELTNGKIVIQGKMI